MISLFILTIKPALVSRSSLPILFLIILSHSALSSYFELWCKVIEKTYSIRILFGEITVFQKNTLENHCTCFKKIF